MDNFQPILNLDLLRTLLLAFPAPCTIRCLLSRGKEHVVRYGTHFGSSLEHEHIVVYRKVCWNINASFTRHTISAPCTIDFNHFLVRLFNLIDNGKLLP